MAAIVDKSLAGRSGTHRPLAGLRVLVEDPSEDVRDLLAVLLGRLGCKTFFSVPEDAIRPRRLDLIVVEPASAVGRRLLEVHAASGSSVPIVCVSIYPRERVDLPSQPEAYLVKPFGASDFRRAVLAAVAGAT